MPARISISSKEMSGVNTRTRTFIVMAVAINKYSY